MAQAPSNPAIMYAGSNNGVYKTVNGGLDWSETCALEIEIVELRVDHNNPDIVYAGTENGVYRSTDGGKSWTKIGLQGTRVNAIGLDPTDRNILYAGLGREPSPSGDFHGLFKTTDGGYSWHEKLKEDLVVYDLLVDTDDPMTIYAGMHGVYLSQDSGKIWTSFNQGLKCLSITRLKISKIEPKFLYAGTADAGVWGRALTNMALPWIPLLLFGD